MPWIGKSEAALQPAEFISQVSKPEKLSSEHFNELEKLREEFPWFAASHILIAKAHKNENRFSYNSLLKKAALYSNDREVLYDYLSVQRSPDSKHGSTNTPIHREERSLGALEPGNVESKDREKDKLDPKPQEEDALALRTRSELGPQDHRTSGPQQRIPETESREPETESREPEAESREREDLPRPPKRSEGGETAKPRNRETPERSEGGEIGKSGNQEIEKPDSIHGDTDTPIHREERSLGALEPRNLESKDREIGPEDQRTEGPEELKLEAESRKPEAEIRKSGNQEIGKSKTQEIRKSGNRDSVPEGQEEQKPEIYDPLKELLKLIPEEEQEDDNTEILDIDLSQVSTYDPEKELLKLIDQKQEEEEELPEEEEEEIEISDTHVGGLLSWLDSIHGEDGPQDRRTEGPQEREPETGSREPEEKEPQDRRTGGPKEREPETGSREPEAESREPEAESREIGKSGNQEIRKSKNQEIDKSGNREIRKSGNRTDVPEGPEVQSDPQKLLDEFIAKRPTMRRMRKDFYSPQEMADKSIRSQSGFVTETLAKLHLKQGRPLKAIEIYEQLQLQNPKNITYFAARIQEIREQIEKEND